jgi:hypothetical protein
VIISPGIIKRLIFIMETQSVVQYLGAKFTDVTSNYGMIQIVKYFFIVTAIVYVCSVSVTGILR